MPEIHAAKIFVWNMFREAATYNHTTDFEEYTASVTGYLCKVTDDVTSTHPETEGDC